MSDMNSGCAVKCWGGAALIGLLTIIMSIVAAQQSVTASIFLGLLAFVLLGLLFTWLFCAPLPEPMVRQTAVAGSAGGMAATSTAGARLSETPTARSEPDAAAQTATDKDAAQEADQDSAAEAGPQDAGAPKANVQDAGDADASEVDSTGAATAGAAGVKPSKALSGQDDLAARKGEWRYEGGDKAEAAAEAEATGNAPADAEKPAATAAPKEVSAASEGDGEADTGAGQGGAQADPAAAVLKPSTPLAGEADLASRKGTWKYDGGAASPSQAGGVGADGGGPKPAASAATGDTSEDFDRDGKLEGSDEGEKPAMMDAPREGGPDNLKEIKGIGPKLEKLCHSMGIYHFDQIANWTDQEIAWVNANLQGFKGRVTRDDWVGQAKILASGGETEFSQRVDDGKVY